MKNKQYRFHSVWEMPAPVDDVWQTLASQPFSWHKWWPELTDMRDLRATEQLEGTSFSCSWESGTGYKLRSDVTVGKVVPNKEVTLHVKGDLEGTVVCRLGHHSPTAHIDFDWQLETTKRWMNILEPLLRPVFTYNHHRVMRSGERGLRRFIKAKKPGR